MNNVEELFSFDKAQATQFLIDAVTSKDLSIKHPTKNIATFSRQSKRYRKANIICFTDEQNANPWYLIQIYDFVNGYICEDQVFNPLNASEINEIERLLCDNQLTFNYYKNSKNIDGLIFSQVRPYHYIYDQYVNYFALSELSNIDEYCYTDKNCFYRELPNNKQLKQVKEQGCYLFPCIKGGDYDSSTATKMHKFLQSSHVSQHVDTELTLWFGITAQKRSWIEQSQSCVKIAKRLSRHYSSITLFIDGWTSLAGGVPDSPKDIARDNSVFFAIRKQLKNEKNLKVVSLIGKDYKDKVSYANTTDAFVANSGTGGMVPMMFSDKPGIIHSNGRLHTFERSYSDKIKVTDIDKITAEEHAIDAGVYSIDWRVIYNDLCGILQLEDELEERKPMKNKFFLNLKKVIFKKKIQIWSKIKK